MKRIARTWRLPPEIEARLGENSYGNQRAIFEADHLLIILHAPPDTNEMDREAVAFLRTPDGRYLVDGRENGERQLRGLLERYTAEWEKLDQAYNTAASASDLFKLLERVAPLNRSSTNLAKALQAAREFVRGDRFLIGVRDEANEISRAFDLLAADAKAALDYRIAKNAELQAEKADEMATAQHKLNVLAAITFPLMALATLLGMNLTHGFEEGSPAIFWSVLAAGFIIGFFVKSWVTARK